jgi:hypothetical protein
MIQCVGLPFICKTEEITMVTAAKPPRASNGGLKKVLRWRGWLRIILELIAITSGGAALYYEIHVSGEVADINENVSTRYLPDWPEHGQYLIDLVHGVERGDELEIQTGYIGYLSFTHPDKFDNFFSELLGAAKRSEGNIRILTLDEPATIVAINEQFGSGKEDDLDTLTSRYPARIEAYVEKHHVLIDQTRFGQKYRGGKYRSGYRSTKEDRADFVDALMFVENDYCFQLTAVGVTVRILYGPPAKELINGPFLWVSHKGQVWKEMIFAYPKFGGIQRGYAFKTRDGHLTEVFLGEFTRKFESEQQTKAVNRGEDLFHDVGDKIKRQSH